MIFTWNDFCVEERYDSIVISGLKNFNATQIFECGQCFRWIKQKSGSYIGVVKGKVAEVEQLDDDTIKMRNTNKEEFYKIWFDYFDLSRDYGEIINIINKDEIMNTTINFGYGIRILKQDIWETLISFILSSNNMIPRIISSIRELSKLFGTELLYNGNSFYTFPTLDSLCLADVNKLESCRAGFRCKYIHNAAQDVKNQVVQLDKLEYLTTDSAREELMKLLGVGPKIADCVLLYSGTKYDVFPTDVWVKRIMEKLYFKKEESFKEIQKFAHDYFGNLAGFAQQYLFYYARENRII